MNLEVLPNEILLDVFCYLTGVDLLRAFYGLNYRLNNLLHDRFLGCSFKFDAVSKGDFDRICHQHLPDMSDYVVNLHLFDTEETPREIKLFLSSSPSFDRFSQLRWLSLSNLRSSHTLMKILEECSDLCNLTRLDLVHCFLADDQVDFQRIIDQIWSLSRLIHCTIGIGMKGQGLFCTPTRLSSSLQSVSIDKIQMKLSQIDRLFEHTPALRCLSMSVLSFIDNDYVPSPLPTLTELSISCLFTCHASNMVNLLQNTVNLRRLQVDLSAELVDGDQWEEVIRNHLPNLEIFQLKMKMTLPAGHNLTGRVDALIHSFESSFWLDEHRWYIRCLTQNRTIHLYTLSNQYEGDFPVSFRSTSAEHDEEEFYGRITKINFSQFVDQALIPFDIRLTQIRDLRINLPLNDRLWSIIPTFKRLKSLTIYFHINTFQSQVQTLLDRAPHLHRLSINQYESTPLQTSIFKYRNPSIRELDLRNINHYFDEDDCITLSRSPLGVQCEVLSILVENCESIISLVENMFRLRSLNVRCKNEKYIERSTSIDDNNDHGDKCIQWLKNHLSPACVVVRDPKLTCNILIWI